MDDLTPAQRTAIECLDGPLLVLAGPGSGKTRVVTRRIAHLVTVGGVSPRNVLAITFTNKAAREMSQRVQTLLPGTKLWVSTFHRFCARLLRQYGEVVGLKSSFSILDTTDQKQLMRRVMQELDYDTVHFSPARVLWQISNAKNDLVTPEMYSDRLESSIGDHWQAVVRRAYPAYQKALLESNAVDFDDLLMHTAMLLSENRELREELDQRFRYILVDEYQDTNAAQYRIVAALSQVHQNLCVTGDPDQSIYGWRGARIENILRFERDFPSARIVRLEQNFRSTQSILRSAEGLIVCNTRRKHKQLLTDKHEGEPVQLLCFESDPEEAEGVARKIRELVDSGEFQWRQIALFYRVNSLSRQLEWALRRHRVPLQVAAGVAFYEREEVKDLLAYLRLIENPADQAAFFRIVNKPLRGLGKTSQDRLYRFAETNGITLLEAASRAREVPKLSARAATGFWKFAALIDQFSLADSGSVADLLMAVIHRVNFTAPWEGGGSEKDQERLANVEELVNAARQYDAGAGDERSLQGFLEETALVNEGDSIDAEAGRVTLMTLHAAKGLEFPVVFIIGVEDGLIPHERSRSEGSEREFEEERRLLFVGITRAQERLFLTESRIRSMHGRNVPTIRSPFLLEVGCAQQTPGRAGTYAEDEPEPGGEPVSAPAADVVPVTTNRITLTTGAHLLAGETVAVEIPQGFAVGMQVRHPQYGRGTVTAVSGFGHRRSFTVRFEAEDRTKTFVASKAPLQPIGGTR